MLNQIVLVGRLTKEPEVKELEDGKTVSNITLAVPRNFKNVNGEYDTDFIDATLWDVAAKNTAEYCKKGDVVGIRGRLQNDTYEKDGNKISKLNLIAERVTFLSSSREHQNPEPERA